MRQFGSAGQEYGDDDCCHVVGVRAMKQRLSGGALLFILIYFDMSYVAAGICCLHGGPLRYSIHVKAKHDTP